MSLKSKFFLLLWICILSIFSIFLAEVVTRLVLQKSKKNNSYSIFYPTDPYMYDEYVGWRHKPNGNFRIQKGEYDILFHTNSLGFRSKEEFIKGNEDNLVISIIGDSFVEALQVEEKDTFVKLLESKLEGELSSFSKIQVQNYGVSHLGLVHYLQIYKYFVRAHSPQIVFICIYPDNDFRNSSPHLEIARCITPHYQMRNGKVVGVKKFIPSSWDKVFKWPLSETTYIGKLRRLFSDVFLFQLIKGEQLLRAHSYLYRVILDWIVKRKLTDLMQFPIDAYIYETPRSKLWEEAWNYGIWSLDSLIKLCRTDGVIPVVVLIPGMWEIKPGMWAHICSLYKKVGGKNTLDKDVIRQALSYHLHALEVPFVDLTDSFIHSYDIGVSPYFERDKHLNFEGHQIVANALYRFLIKSGILNSHLEFFQHGINDI